MKFVNYKIILGLIFLIVLGLIVKNATTELVKIKGGKTYITELENRLESEKKRNKFLTEQLKYVKTDEFIENESREKLGLVKSGEFVVQEKLEKKLNAKIDEKLNKPNWQQWWELFM